MRVRPRRPFRRLALGAQLLLAFTASSALAACMGNDENRSGAAPGRDRAVVEDAGPIHVHALGVNPKDESLFIATHTGLFRASGPGAKPRRVADRWQDTMGFTVTGRDRFLASGHPDGREDLPPFLGLIESLDAGRTWREISLQGTMDFHVLEAARNRVYGFGTRWGTQAQRLLVSNDGGESWWRRTAPEPLIDLAIVPGDPDTAVAAGTRGLHLTRDAAESWSELPGVGLLLTWLGPRLVAVDPRGVVRVAVEGFGRWEIRGRVDGEPAALASGPGRQLYVALHDGTIKHSVDGGVSWSVWGTPARGGRKRADRAADDAAAPAEPQNSEDPREESPRRSHKALRDVPGEPKEK